MPARWRTACVALAVLAVAGLRHAGGVQPPPVSPIDLDRAAALFAEARRLSEADDGALWGRRLYGPMMFVDRATRTVVANVRDKRGHLARRGDDLHVGRLPDAISLGNTAVEWAGVRWSMVLWPPQAGASWTGALMMHESFHRIQPSLGIPLAVPRNHHLDTAKGRLWLRLEWRALAEALEDDEPLRSEALEDALVFRAYRRSLFDGAAREETELELNEGLAEYTGLRLSGADDEMQRRQAIAGLRLYDGPGPLVRRFAYATGPPYGLLLDAARPGWQKQVSRRTDLGRLLIRAIRFRLPRALAEEAERRAGLYDVERLRDEEDARERERQERLAVYRERYVDGAVLIIDMTGVFNYAFSPYDVHALDGIGTVYGSMQLTGPWGSLNARGGALVVEDARGHRRVTVPVANPFDPPPEGTITGEGWTLDLAAGWTLVRGRRPGDWMVRNGDRGGGR